MRPKTAPHPSQGGFTILELLVIVFIIGIMVVIALPFTLQQLTRLRIEGFATEVVNLIQATRNRSIRDNQEYPIDWLDEDGDLVLDTITGVSGLGGIDAEEIDTGVLDSANSSAVKLSLTDRGLEPYGDPTDPTNDCFALTKYDKQHEPAPLAYSGTGVADPEAAFCFQDPNGNVLQVAIDSPAGSPKIRKLVASGKFSPDTWEWEWY